MWEHEEEQKTAGSFILYLATKSKTFLKRVNEIKNRDWTSHFNQKLENHIWTKVLHRKILQDISLKEKVLNSTSK